MRVFRFLFNVGHAPAHASPDVKSLSRLRRLFHVKVRRHVFGITVGTGLMLTGSAMAINAQDVLAIVHVPHVLWDALAYFLHGFGSLPVMAHVEPLWDALKD